jgi:CheY-like chemotaxis protein
MAPTLGTVRADPGQVHQVLLNLAVNARDAMPDGGTLTIETHEVEIDGVYAQEHVDAQPGTYVLLAVSDTGTGMDAATRARVFEPFFTTKEKGKGTGLGLATVYGIVRQHGGHISLYSEIGRGTTFKIYLPRAEASAEPERRRRTVEARGGTETILLVEDEAPVRDFVTSALKRAGYQVLAAADGDEALRLETTAHDQIDLLLSDGMMSGIRVPEMVAEFRKRRPDARVLLMSGYAQEAFIRQGLMVAGGAFLQKPFTAAGLVAKVREVLDALL